MKNVYWDILFYIVKFLYKKIEKDDLYEDAPCSKLMTNVR